jgi:hypothetical protein
VPGLGLLPNQLSAAKPERTARVAFRAGAQAGTMRLIDSSGSRRISRTACSPTTRRGNSHPVAGRV